MLRGMLEKSYACIEQRFGVLDLIQTSIMLFTCENVAGLTFPVIKYGRSCTITQRFITSMFILCMLPCATMEFRRAKRTC